MKHKISDIALFALATFVPFSVAVVGCGSKKKTETVFTTDGPFVQTERLARPAVNEGLLISNVNLIAFNSIPPSSDVSVIGSNAFTNEVVAVLNAVDDAVAPAGNVDNNDVVQAFLPDVMRIDTTLSVPLGTPAYSFGAIAVGTVVRPIAGRKLEDDVVDITLSVLGGGPLGDNVDYDDTHAMLNGQTAFGGAATFPFLAPAN